MWNVLITTKKNGEVVEDGFDTSQSKLDEQLRFIKQMSNQNFVQGTLL